MNLTKLIDLNFPDDLIPHDNLPRAMKAGRLEDMRRMWEALINPLETNIRNEFVRGI